MLAKLKNLLEKYGAASTIRLLGRYAASAALARLGPGKEEREACDALLRQLRAGEYERVILRRGSFGWHTPLVQRAQQLARALSESGCLVLYEATPPHERVRGAVRLGERLWLVNLRAKGFAAAIERETAAGGRPRWLLVASPESRLAVKTVRRLADRGWTVLYDYIDAIDPAIGGGKRVPRKTAALYRYAMENKDWNEEWETNSFEPIVIPELCCIHDTRHEADSTVPYDIIINPRMAFGSGTHETTSQLVELLLRSDFHGQNVLDMGCGTCILGICMSLRGAERVVAIDIDEQSVDNSLLNCGLNHLNNIYVVHGDASAIRETFDTIIANIHRNIIINDLPTYVAHLRQEGTLIVSGFFTEDIPAIQAAAEAQGLKLVHQQERNEWAVASFLREA